MISGTTTPAAGQAAGRAIDRGVDLDAAGVLASARRARATANAAEAQLLADAVTWAELHTVSEIDEAATWWDGTRAMGRDTGVPIAGDGCPLVAESAVVEFATAVGLPQQAGRHLIGQALELAHRLPKTWARVQSGSLPAWRARRIAEATTTLSVDAVAWVDTQVAPFAHKTGPAQTQRLIDEAIARFMPAHAAERRDRAAEQRYLRVEHDQVSFAGTVRIHGEADLVDGLDLEDALQTGAARLADLGSTEPLDVRRAQALGMLARGELHLPYEPSTPATTGQTTGDVPTGSTSGPVWSSREIVVYAHLSADVLRSGDPDAVVELTSTGGGTALVTAGQVAQWCGAPATSKITVKPVIDLNQTITTAGHRPTEKLEEQVKLRDRTCRFPFCHRAATHADLDHIKPYDPDGPPGQTTSANLAVLCRLHHRMKTHCGWTYTMLRPGVFRWRSPYGYTYLRDRTGTTDLTPKPVQPPESPPEPPEH